MTQKITSFKNLLTWKIAHDLVLEIYSLTNDFPKEERYSLTDQIRRAAVSVTSNIAEGFGRYTFNDKRHFLIIAKGSLFELQSQLILATDLRYLDSEKLFTIEKAIENTKKLLYASIKNCNTMRNKYLKKSAIEPKTSYTTI